MNHFHFNRERNLEKIQSCIARMPGLSTTVIKVLETCNDPQASANDLKRVISLDPILTGRVLKLINSAYYSTGKSISSLTRAIIMLGVNTVKNLALSFTIIDSLKGRRSGRCFSTDEFWKHSVCVGVVAKSLAATIGVPLTQREEFFVAGLLHDLGKLPLHMQFPEEYCRICEKVHSGEEALYPNEVKYLGVDHGTVGRILGNKWCLGSSLIESLSCHHTPAESSEKHTEFVSVVALANQLAIHLGIGHAGDQFSDQSQIRILMGEVGVEWKMIDELQETACQEIERAKFFLEVARDG